MLTRATSHNIERRKQVEADAPGDAFLDSVIENMPAIVVVKNAADLSFVRANRAWRDPARLSAGRNHRACTRHRSPGRSRSF